MAAQAAGIDAHDTEEDISTSLRTDPEEDLSTRQRMDPEAGIDTRLRSEPNRRPAPFGGAGGAAAVNDGLWSDADGHDDMQSLIAAADAHDDMQSLIAAADAHLEHHTAASKPPMAASHPPKQTPHRPPGAADPASLRPSPIPKPPVRRPGNAATEQAASHPAVSQFPDRADVHQSVDLNLSELAPPSTRKSSKAGWLVFTLLVIGSAAGGFFLRPVLSNPRVHSRTATPAATTAAAPAGLVLPGMLRGGKSGLGEADAALAKAELELGHTAEVTLARARFQFLRWLELGGPTAELGLAVTAAKESGVEPGELAFAEVVTALVGKDAALPGVLTRIDGQPQRKSDAYYLLAAGVALGQRGNDECISRFRSAIGSEPGLHLAETYLVRAMILYGNRTEAERRLKLLDPSGAHQDRVDALEALIWLHRKAEGATNKPAPSVANDADVPFSMAWIPAGLAYLAEPEETSRRGHLRRSIDAIETPSESAIMAALAVSREDGELALSAAKKATATWASPDALRVLGHAAVLSSDLEALAVEAKGPIALELAAVSAYERGDSLSLRKIAKEAGAPPGVRLRVERLFDMRPLVDSDLSTLRNPKTVGGNLVALDALLDAGNLVAARELVDAWPKGGRSTLRAHRRARLLRYEGETEAAIKAIESAGESPPAIMERVLLAAEVPRRASAIIQSSDFKKLSEGGYLNAYLVAHSGSRQGAAILLAREKPPSKDDSLSMHIAAALAHGAMRNTKAKESAQKLLDAFPNNPDIRKAAAGVALKLPPLPEPSDETEAPPNEAPPNDAPPNED